VSLPWSSSSSFCELTCEFPLVSFVSVLIVLVAWPVSQACLPPAAVLVLEPVMLF
jgi:hypothetical protein